MADHQEVREEDYGEGRMSADKNGMDGEPLDSGDNTVRVTGRVTRPLVLGMKELRAMEEELCWQ